MPQSPILSAVVLAGGKSSRMGEDKALIKFEGKPLLTKICCVALECASQVYIITSKAEKYQEILPSGCLVIRENPQPSPQGPLIAFSQALRFIETPWVLLLACDLPKLTATPVQQWSQQLVDCPEEAIAFLPKNTAGWEPLCGFYRRCCLESLTSYIESGGKSFQGWLSTHLVQEIPLDNFDILFNCNTKEDLAQIQD